MGPTAPARALSPTCWPAAQTTPSPAARPSTTARTCCPWSREIRARMGVFLAFQYPVELPGVRAWQFLKAGVDARRVHNGEEEMSAREFQRLLDAKVKQVEIDPELVRRAVNEGFSGGEKKRNEILQMGRPRTTPSAAGRDRLRPGHRRPAHRLRRREQAALRGQRHGAGDPLPSECSTTCAPTRARAPRRAHRALWRAGAGAGAGGKGV